MNSSSVLRVSEQQGRAENSQVKQLSRGSTKPRGAGKHPVSPITQHLPPSSVRYCWLPEAKERNCLRGGVFKKKEKEGKVNWQLSLP